MCPSVSQDRTFAQRVEHKEKRKEAQSSWWKNNPSTNLALKTLLNLISWKPIHHPSSRSLPSPSPPPPSPELWFRIRGGEHDSNSSLWLSLISSEFLWMGSSAQQFWRAKVLLHLSFKLASLSQLALFLAGKHAGVGSEVAHSWVLSQASSVSAKRLRSCQL